MIKEERQTTMVPGRKDHQPHSPFYFFFILSITENKQCILTNCWLCKERQNCVGKVCRNRAAFRQLCDVSKSSLVWEGAGCVKERAPQALGKGDPGGLCYACTHSHLLTAPSKCHIIITFQLKKKKKETEYTERGRQSRPVNRWPSSKQRHKIWGCTRD